MKCSEWSFVGGHPIRECLSYFQQPRGHATAGDTVRTYTYPPTGHALQSVQTQRPPAPSTLDEFGYDAAGNTTRRKVGSSNQTLDWDLEGRLSKVTEPGKKDTSFIYDAGGARLLRKDPTGTILYLGGQELRLDSASGTVTGTRYYPFGDGAVAMRTASGVTWLTGDHQGTAQIAITSQTLTVTQRRVLVQRLRTGSGVPAVLQRRSASRNLAPPANVQSLAGVGSQVASMSHPCDSREPLRCEAQTVGRHRCRYLVETSLRYPGERVSASQPRTVAARPIASAAYPPTIP
ncbi:hypothetical protein [Actinocrispum sp. NPDC049592]|uniref:hypothetical protein n=1 Tax=Actinocrispum sp. NPDC049592 TaxID=3154835 RepID=UPI0034432584